MPRINFRLLALLFLLSSFNTQAMQNISGKLSTLQLRLNDLKTNLDALRLKLGTLKGKLQGGSVEVPKELAEQLGNPRIYLDSMSTQNLKTRDEWDSFIERIKDTTTSLAITARILELSIRNEWLEKIAFQLVRT